jgi:hypothetical protein
VGVTRPRRSAVHRRLRVAARCRPPFTANHHSLEPKTPVGRKPLTLRVVKFERTSLDIDDRRIAFGANRQRAKRWASDRSRWRSGGGRDQRVQVDTQHGEFGVRFRAGERRLCVESMDCNVALCRSRLPQCGQNRPLEGPATCFVPDDRIGKSVNSRLAS